MSNIFFVALEVGQAGTAYLMYRRFASKVKVTSETLFLLAKNANDSSMDKVADADYWLLQQNCDRGEAEHVERKVRGDEDFDFCTYKFITNCHFFLENFKTIN